GPICTRPPRCSRTSAAPQKERERPSPAAAGATPGTSESRAHGPRRRRLLRTMHCTRTRSITSSSQPMPASTAPRLLESDAAGALERARSLDVEELFQIIERSGLRGRGGAGYPLVEKLRGVRRNAAGGSAYVVANGYDAGRGRLLPQTLLLRQPAAVIRGIAIAAREGGAAGA